MARKKKEILDNVEYDEKTQSLIVNKPILSISEVKIEYNKVDNDDYDYSAERNSMYCYGTKTDIVNKLKEKFDIREELDRSYNKYYFFKIPHTAGKLECHIYIKEISIYDIQKIFDYLQ